MINRRPRVNDSGLADTCIDIDDRVGHDNRAPAKTRVRTHARTRMHHHGYSRACLLQAALFLPASIAIADGDQDTVELVNTSKQSCCITNNLPTPIVLQAWPNIVEKDDVLPASGQCSVGDDLAMPTRTQKR